MNRFASNLNPSRVWMDQSPNPNNRSLQMDSSFGSRSSDVNYWDSRNSPGQRYPFNPSNLQGNNNGNGNNMGNGGGGLANGSFLSFLEQRNNQSRSLMPQPPMQSINIGQNDSLYRNNDRIWGRNDNLSMRNVEPIRGPLLNEPNRDWRQSSVPIQSNRPSLDEANKWKSLEPLSNDNGGNKRNSFMNNFSDNDLPVKITLPRKDIGSKIIGKSGILIRDLEARSRARVEVIDKAGTDLAVVELYGSNVAKKTATDIIMQKCNMSNPQIEFPNGDLKPKPLFDSPISSSQGNAFDFRRNSDGGSGLLKLPDNLMPMSSTPNWRNQPKPLMSQQFRHEVANKTLLNLPNKINMPTKPFYNSSVRNVTTQRRGKKRIKKPSKPKLSNSESPSAGASTPKKAKKNDLYADADFALAPKVSESTDDAQKAECNWMDNLKDLTQSLAKVRDNFVPQTVGPNPTENWTKNSQLAYDHFAAGSFETGLKILLKGNGIVNYEPFKQYVMAAFRSTKLYIGLTSEMPNLVIPLYRKPISGSNDASGLPAPIIQLSELLKQLQVGYAFTTAGKYVEAIDVFRQILFCTPLLLTLEKSESSKVKKLMIICREYITGLSMEIVRNKLPKNTLDEQKRNCELAAYFTRCNLQTSHRLLTLSTALNLFFKLKNFKTAASFAQRLLEQDPSPEMIPQLNKIVEVCNSNLVDEHELNYDDAKTFVFCSQTFNRIKLGEAEVRCPFCHVRCLAQCKGKICDVCTVAEIGKDLSSDTH